MANKTTIIGSIASLAFVLGITSGEAVAQMSHETHSSETEQIGQFRRIEQPLGNKVAVTLGGLGLIGLELWWFLLSKPKSQKATTEGGIQEITVTVDGGYEPSQIVVQAGQPLRLNFHRKDPSSCLEEVRFPDFHIAQELPLNEVTPIEFTPNKPGKYEFACGMNMFRGEIQVEGQKLQSSSTMEGKVMAEPQSKVSDPRYSTESTAGAKPAYPTVERGVQKVTINVDKGYTPDYVVVKAGQPVQFNFLRQNPSNCLAKVFIPDFGIAADLPLNETTAIKFTPEKAGEYAFTCGMNMFRGAIRVEASSTSHAEKRSTQLLT